MDENYHEFGTTVHQFGYTFLYCIARKISQSHAVISIYEFF